MSREIMVKIKETKVGIHEYDYYMTVTLPPPLIHRGRVQRHMAHHGQFGTDGYKDFIQHTTYRRINISGKYYVTGY